MNGNPGFCVSAMHSGAGTGGPDKSFNSWINPPPKFVDLRERMDFAAIVLGLELLALSNVHLTSAEHPAARKLCVHELIDEMFEDDAWVATHTGAVAEDRIERLRIAMILHPDDESAGRITDSPCDHRQSDGDAKSFHKPIHDRDAGYNAFLSLRVLRADVRQTRPVELRADPADRPWNC
jgi:hypothetical protein